MDYYALGSTNGLKKKPQYSTASMTPYTSVQAPSTKSSTANSRASSVSSGVGASAGTAATRRRDPAGILHDKKLKKFPVVGVLEGKSTNKVSKP